MAGQHNAGVDGRYQWTCNMSKCKWHVSYPALFAATKNPLPLHGALEVLKRLKLISKPS